MIEINGKILCDRCFKELDKESDCSCCFSGNYANSLQNGTIINGRFIVGKQVRESDTVKEYLCYDPQRSDTVLIKEFFPKMLVSRNGDNSVQIKDADNLTAYNHLMQKFIKLMQIPQRMSSDCFIKVENAFYENNTAYFVIKNHSLLTVREYIESDGKISDKQAVLSLSLAVKGLCELKENGFVGGNISDRNVYIGDNGIIADGFETDQYDLAHYMKESVAFGKTLFYMSAYDFVKKEKDISSDIFSFGAVLYTMLTAKQPQSPFKEEAQFDKTALENSTNEKLLVKIIEKMCRIEGEKYDSLLSLVKDVNRLSRRYGLEKIKISSALEETNKTKNNGKTIKIVIALLFVILVVAAGFIFADKLPVFKGGEIPSLSEIFRKLWFLIKSKFSGGLL